MVMSADMIFFRPGDLARNILDMPGGFARHIFDNSFTKVGVFT
jgi:hypothetical protein